MVESLPIINYISRYVALTDDEKQQFASSFEPMKVKKRQFIVQPNFISKHRNYVIKGAFRAFVVAETGIDQTINFAVDDWWITDYNSYIFQQPATMFVVV